MNGQPDRIASITIPLRPGSAATVRTFLDEEVRLDSMRTAEAALLATEIIANAVKHGDASEADVRVETEGSVVRIGVSHISERPITSPERGFGFTLLDRLSHDWSYSYVDGRVDVWFEVRKPGSVSLTPGTMSEDELVLRMADDPTLAQELINRYRPLALSIARRYRGKGIHEDDLEQVAVIALLKALHRFDPERGSLRSFAAVTIAGELKRLLRDRGWSVRVPRGLQEQALSVAWTMQKLTQENGRSPSPAEIARAMDLSEDEVSEALSVAQGYSALSLDDTGPEDGPSLADALGDLDLALNDTETRDVIDDALQALSERDRLVVYLRFYEDLTQTEIAERIGVSQMQVSRILTKALNELGDIIQADE